MKTLTKLSFMLLAVALLGLASCEKESGTAPDRLDLNAISGLNAVALTEDTMSDNALYAVNTCKRGERPDSVAFSGLNTSVTTYLTANYPGYIFKKAFKTVSSSDAVTGYIVVIRFEENPVGLKFDSSGSFVKVLEQREHRDLHGKGWRPGGRFDCRDGLNRDTIAISEIPLAITSYFTANYANDTLLNAFSTKNGSIVVISANKGLFATIFNSDNAFDKRKQLPAPGGKGAPIAETALSASTLNYLSATYPSYVFKKAFVVRINSVVQGYVVLIDANATKYAISFDASGNFVKNLAIK